MNKVSKNSFDLIVKAGEKVKGKFLKALGATLLAVAPLLLCVFGLYTIPVAVLLFGVIETGYIRYIRALINNENPSFKLIFSEFKNPGLEIFLGAILICMFVGGAVLLFVPAVVFVTLYSMSLYWAEYKKSAMPFDAMFESSSHMKGNRINMFSYKSLFWLMYVVVIIMGLAGVMGAFWLGVDHTLWAVVLFIGTYLITTLLWSVITIYYKASSELFFQELLIYNEKKQQENKKVEIIKEEASEEAPVVEKKPVKKQTTAKTSAKASVEKKTTKTTTASKTTTKKSTSTKTPAKSTSAKNTQSGAKKTTKATTKK